MSTLNGRSLNQPNLPKKRASIKEAVEEWMSGMVTNDTQSITACGSSQENLVKNNANEVAVTCDSTEPETTDRMEKENSGEVEAKDKEVGTDRVATYSRFRYNLSNQVPTQPPPTPDRPVAPVPKLKFPTTAKQVYTPSPANAESHYKCYRFPATFKPKVGRRSNTKTESSDQDLVTLSKQLIGPAFFFDEDVYELPIKKTDNDLTSGPRCPVTGQIGKKYVSPSMIRLSHESKRLRNFKCAGPEMKRLSTKSCSYHVMYPSTRIETKCFPATTSSWSNIPTDGSTMRSQSDLAPQRGILKKNRRGHVETPEGSLPSDDDTLADVMATDRPLELDEDTLRSLALHGPEFQSLVLRRPGYENNFGDSSCSGEILGSRSTTGRKRESLSADLPLETKECDVAHEVKAICYRGEDDTMRSCSEIVTHAEPVCSKDGQHGDSSRMRSQPDLTCSEEQAKYAKPQIRDSLDSLASLSMDNIHAKPSTLPDAIQEEETPRNSRFESYSERRPRVGRNLYRVLDVSRFNELSGINTKSLLNTPGLSHTQMLDSDKALGASKAEGDSVKESPAGTGKRLRWGDLPYTSKTPCNSSRVSRDSKSIQGNKFSRKKKRSPDMIFGCSGCSPSTPRTRLPALGVDSLLQYRLPKLASQESGLGTDEVQLASKSSDSLVDWSYLPSEILARVLDDTHGELSGKPSKIAVNKNGSSIQTGVRTRKPTPRPPQESKRREECCFCSHTFPPKPSCQTPRWYNQRLTKNQEMAFCTRNERLPFGRKDKVVPWSRFIAKSNYKVINCIETQTASRSNQFNTNSKRPIRKLGKLRHSTSLVRGTIMEKELMEICQETRQLIYDSDNMCPASTPAPRGLYRA